MKNGFSLLELIITLLIISIIAAISYPLYTQHLLKVRRVEAKIALYELANRLEHYYAEHHHYNGATLSRLHMPSHTEHGYYLLKIEKSSIPGHYLLSAIPQDIQASQDTLCGMLTLDDKGQQGSSGTGAITECW